MFLGDRYLAASRVIYPVLFGSATLHHGHAPNAFRLHGHEIVIGSLCDSMGACGESVMAGSPQNPFVSCCTGGVEIPPIRPSRPLGTRGGFVPVQRWTRPSTATRQCWLDRSLNLISSRQPTLDARTARHGSVYTDVLSAKGVFARDDTQKGSKGPRERIAAPRHTT